MTKWAARIILAIMFGLMLSFFVALAHGTTSGRRNTFGAVIFDHNPNQYMYGSIAGGNVIGDNEDHLFTNVRFQPSHTFMLYNETILFCGNQADKFANMGGPIVVTYRSVSHQMYKGIACHDLISVDRVESKDGE
jgi:hypothetical protein